MAEAQDRKDATPLQPQPAEREVPLDTRLLSDAVIELNISRKNVGIYPPGHVQITRSIDRAYEVLLKLFEIREEMTLGVAKDTLFVGQDYLDRKNPVYRDFALSLSQQGIAAATFIRGLDRSELVRFHRIITTKPGEIASAGGIATVVAGADIPHIRVLAIDYGSFHRTEEQEIFKPQTKTAEKSGAGLWQDFVSLLSAGTLAAGGQGASLKDSIPVDPAELARLLNERKLDSNAALQTYDRIISAHVRTTAERKELTKEQSETLKKLNALVKDLHPELRKQFLSVAFNRVTSRPSSPVPDEEVLGGLSDDMVIEMLKQASEEGKEISPTLTGLLGKLTGIRGHAQSASRPGTRPAATRQETSQPSSQTVQTPQAPPAEDVPMRPEHMNKLFDRESYEQYVISDYDTMLKNMSEKAEVLGAAGGEQFPVEEFEKTLDDEHLDLEIGRALLAFMEENIELEDYSEFARKLGTLLPDLLSTGNFVLLLDTLETLRRHTKEKPAENIRAVAANTLTIFSDPSFAEKAVSSFDLWSRTKGREGAGFLLALGPAVAPGIMDIFAADETLGGRRIVFDLLCNFGNAAVGEALKRLRDTRAYYVRNLLMLIRWVGSPAVVPSVKPLLNHGDRKVCLEALAVLLRFRDASAVSTLRQELHSKDPDTVSYAVFLAGQYRVAEVVEDILPLFKKVILLDADYAANEEIIRALGEIGDPRAVPELEKMARAAWTLYPASLARMKQTLFESLGRYPRESIAGLLRTGERSNDDKIRRACRKLAELP